MNLIELTDLDEREIVPGYFARLVHSDKMTVAFWRVLAGSPLPEHSHLHEQIAQVMSGEFELTVGGVTNKLGPGQVVVIPGGVPHSGRAITACELMDVFSPPREEYK